MALICGKVIRATNAAGTVIAAERVRFTYNGFATLSWLKLGAENKSSSVHGYLDGQPLKIVGYEDNTVRVEVRAMIVQLEVDIDPLLTQYRINKESS